MEISSSAANSDQNLAPAAVPEVVKKRSRKRSIIIFTVVTAINVTLFAILWTQLMTPRVDQSQSDSSGLGDISSPLIGQAAPDFTLSSLNGSSTQIHLASLKGKAVVLNFWEASCGPCNDEAPFLQQTWKEQLQPKGVALIGIDGPEKSSDALAFLHKFEVTYPNVKDSITGATSVDYGTTGNPETFFIDQHGIVKARWLGPLTEAGLQTELAKINLK